MHTVETALSAQQEFFFWGQNMNQMNQKRKGIKYEPNESKKEGSKGEPNESKKEGVSAQQEGERSAPIF